MPDLAGSGRERSRQVTIDIKKGRQEIQIGPEKKAQSRIETEGEVAIVDLAR